MEKKKKNFHFWRQIRRPFCFIIALSIVAIYCVNLEVFAYVSSGNQNFIDRFGIDTTSQDYVFYYRYGKAQYDALGNSSSNLTNISSSPIRTSWYGSVGSWWFTWFDSWTYPDNVTIDSVTYDLTGAYVIANTNDSWVDSNGRGVKFVISDGYCAIADSYVVSESPFHFIYADSGGTTRVVNVTTAEDCGLYMLYLPSYAFGNQDYTMVFTSLDVFLSSSDGDSGYTTLTTTSTDLDLSSDELFNFNNLKRDGIIINSGDPVTPDSETLGQHYTYCGLDAYFSDGDADSIKLNFTVSPNEYMRLHPEEYIITYDITAYIVPNTTNHPSILLTYSYTDLVGLDDILYGNLSSYVNVYFSDLYDANVENSLADALRGWWGDVTGSNTQYYNSNGSVISYGGTRAVGGTRSFGGYSLNPNLKIQDIVFQGTVKVECISVNPSQISGAYRWQQGLISGEKTILENNIATNYNPPGEYDPQYPATINNNGSSGGSGNITVNPTSVNNFNAMVEYLFNLDASDLTNITGNIANNFQYVIQKVSDTSTNGFWGVLKNTYDLIPDEIWTWLKVSVGVILGSCTYQWVINGVRIRRG